MKKTAKKGAPDFGAQPGIIDACDNTPCHGFQLPWQQR
jgi:hypothetical protein